MSYLEEMSSHARLEKQTLNHSVLKSQVIVLTVLALSYVLEVVKGSRGMGYIAMLLVLLYGPYILALYVYKKDSTSDKMRYIIMSGFYIFYAVALFGASSRVAFVYVIPTTIIMTVYQDTKIIFFMTIVNNVINVAFIVYKFLTTKMTAIDMVDKETQFAGIVLIGVFTYFTAKTMKKISESKMQLILEKQVAEQENLEKVMEVTGTISEKVMELSEEARRIEEQSDTSLKSMEEIAQGTLDTAENMQKQLFMSQEIRGMAQESVTLSQDSIVKCDTTKENTHIGVTHMDELADVSQESKEACDIVSESIYELSRRISEVQNILGMIEGITKKTSLLSLNASIEAARAGEAGKGFAVVAGDIQSLSEQTKTATESIKKIFQNLEVSNEKAIDAALELGQVNTRQLDLIQQSKENFHLIQQDIEEVAENAGKQNQHLEQVNQSNDEIGNRIEHVSSFVEELTANAETTKELSGENLSSIRRMNDLLGQVLEEMKKLEQ